MIVQVQTKLLLLSRRGYSIQFASTEVFTKTKMTAERKPKFLNFCDLFRYLFCGFVIIFKLVIGKSTVFDLD